MFYAVMLNAVKHPCTGFLTTPRNDKERVLGMTRKTGMTEKSVRHVLRCHAERSEASMHWIPRYRSE
jgi:hypothetical protein